MSGRHQLIHRPKSSKILYTTEEQYGHNKSDRKRKTKIYVVSKKYIGIIPRNTQMGPKTKARRGHSAWFEQKHWRISIWAVKECFG